MVFQSSLSSEGTIKGGLYTFLRLEAVRGDNFGYPANLTFSSHIWHLIARLQLPFFELWVCLRHSWNPRKRKNVLCFWHIWNLINRIEVGILFLLAPLSTFPFNSTHLFPLIRQARPPKEGSGTAGISLMHPADVLRSSSPKWRWSLPALSKGSPAPSLPSPCDLPQEEAPLPYFMWDLLSLFRFRKKQKRIEKVSFSCPLHMHFLYWKKGGHLVDSLFFGQRIHLRPHADIHRRGRW